MSRCTGALKRYSTGSLPVACTISAAMPHHVSPWRTTACCGEMLTKLMGPVPAFRSPDPATVRRALSEGRDRGPGIVAAVSNSWRAARRWESELDRMDSTLVVAARLGPLRPTLSVSSCDRDDRPLPALHHT